MSTNSNLGLGDRLHSIFAGVLSGTLMATANTELTISATGSPEAGMAAGALSFLFTYALARNACQKAALRDLAEKRETESMQLSPLSSDISGVGEHSVREHGARGLPVPRPPQL